MGNTGNGDGNLFEKIREQGEQGASPASELDEATKAMADHMWVDSILLNYTEELDVNVPVAGKPGEFHRLQRRISMGITVKSDNRAPLKILHNAASKALNSHFEDEKERWLDAEKMRVELAKAKEQLGIIHKEDENDKGGTSEPAKS